MNRDRRALKDAVIQVLSCALQPDSDVQRLAEERKKALEVTDEYAIILLDIIQGPDEAMDEKHMASIFLKNYLRDFFPDRDSISAKARVLSRVSSMLTDSLTHPHATVRVMVSQSLCQLVYKGFWPCVNQKLMAMLTGDNGAEIYAAVSFLKHLLDRDEITNIPITPDFFDALIELYQTTNFPEVRLDSIYPMVFIAAHCVSSSVAQSHMLEKISRVFVDTLQQPHSEMNHYQLKTEILRGIIVTVQLEPVISSHLVFENLPVIGQLMTDCSELLKKVIMGVLHMPIDEFEYPMDPQDFIELIVHILRLVETLNDEPVYNSVLMDGFEELLYCTIVFMCCYSENPPTNEMDEAVAQFPARVQAVLTLTNILEGYESCRVKLFFDSLNTVFQKHITECTEQRSNYNNYYLKIMESLMFCLGVIRNCFPQNTIFKKSHIFPHEFYLAQWTEMIRTESNYFLLGRLYWLAGKYSTSLTPELLSIHIKGIVSIFRSNCKSMYVAAGVALRYHMAAYPFSSEEHKMVIIEASADIMETFFRIYQKLSGQPQLFLNAMSNLFKLNEEIARLYVHNVLDMLIATIINFFSDVQVLRDVNFVLRSLAMYESCSAAINDTMLPFVLKLIFKNATEKLKTHEDLPERGLDLLNTIVVCSPQPVNDNLVMHSFLSACKFIMETQDIDLSLNEISVTYLATALIKLLPQIRVLHDEKGDLLTEYIPKIVFDLLDPSKMIWTAKVGRLVVLSLMNFPEIFEPHIENLLKSILSSFQMTVINDKFEKRKGLMLIFFYILMYRPENTLQFLSSIPGPNGGCALKYMFTKCELPYVVNADRIEKMFLTVILTEIVRFAVDSNCERINALSIELSVRNEPRSGIEYLYYLLIRLLISETTPEAPDSDEDDFQIKYMYDDFRDYEREDVDVVLITYHPWGNLDIKEHIITFLQNLNPYLNNVYKKALLRHEEDIIRSLGIALPDSPME